jgi:hypothetical protein
VDAVLPMLRRSDDIKNLGDICLYNDMEMTVKHVKSEAKRGSSVKISEAVNVTSTLKRRSAENAAPILIGHVKIM